MRHIVTMLTLLVAGLLVACTAEERKQEQMVNLQRVKHDPETQLINLNSAISMAENDGSLYARRALVLLKKGEVQQALADADDAVRLTNNDPASLFVKAQVLRRLNQQEEALKLALKAERNSYQSSSLYVLLAELYLQKRQFELAAAYIDDAQKLSPADEFAFYYKGKIKEATADTVGAVRNYRAAIEQDAEFMEPKRELAGILIARSFYDSAQIYVKQASLKAPEDAQLLFYKGLIAEAANKKDSASYFYKGAVAANDTLQGPHYKLGLLLYTQGDLEGTIAHLEKAKRYSLTKTYLTTLANSYERTGRNQESLATYQQLLRVEPKYTYAYQAIARLKYKIRKALPDSTVVQSSELIENEK